jgi:anti-sigma B factor antagonist
MLFINHTELTGSPILMLQVRGPINASTFSDFEDYFKQLLKRNKIYIIMNAAELEYLSSAGIGTILYIQKELVALNGYFIICNLSGEISLLFNLLSFDSVLCIAGTADEATQIMEKQIEIRKSPDFKPKIEKPITSAIKEEKIIDKDSEPAVSRSKGEQEETIEFESPYIVECDKCKGLIRVKRNGTYQCPHCRREFNVLMDQTIVF